MNTLIVLGVLMLGLGFLVFAAAAVLLLTKFAMTSGQEELPTATEAAPLPPPPQRVAPAASEAAQTGTAPASPLQAHALRPPDEDEEDDEFAHVSTGVLNLADFKDFEELVAAADNLVSKQDDK